MGIITPSESAIRGSGAALGTDKLIVSRTTDTPPAPTTGDRYIVPVGATGAFSTHDQEIATWNGTTWSFLAAEEGWQAYIDDADEQYQYDGTTWNLMSYDPSTPPATHATSHEDGGTDEVDVGGLSGELADPQPPKAHESSHHESGSDQLDVEDLATDSVTPSDVVQGHTTFGQLSIGQPDGWKASVVSTLNAPPGGAIGVRHRIGSSPTGLWTGHAHELVEKNTMGTWNFLPNTVGDVHYHVADARHYGWSGSAWLTMPYDHAASHKHGGGDEVATSTAGANLIPKSDASGKLNVAWMPAALIGALNFQGFWNASTNTPTLADGTGTKGHFYIATVAGTQDLGSGSKSYNIGDWVLHDGSIWEKIDHTDAVASVFGRIGAVVAVSGDYTHAETSGQTVNDHHNQQHALGGADHTTATLAQLNAKVSDATLIAAWDEAQVYYVGKHGNDSNDGKSINEAMLTITAAIARAVALTPSATNRFTIRVVDAGVYTESISVPAYVFLDAPNVKLIGTLTLSGSPAAADIDTAAPLANGIAVESIGAGDRFLKAKLLQVSGTGVTGAGIKVTFSGHLLVDVGHIDADGTCHGIWSDAGNVYGRVGRLDVEEGVAAYIKANNSDISVYVGSVEIRHASGKGIHITSLGGVASLVDLQIGRAGSLGTFIDLDAGSAHVYVGQVDGVTALYNLSGASNLYLFGGKISGTRTSTTSGDEKVTEAGVAPLHAATHKDGGADELDVEELASAGAAGAIATSDGAGAVAMVPHDPVMWFDAARLDSPDGTADVPGSMDAAPIGADSVASNVPVCIFPDDVEKGKLLKSTIHVPIGVEDLRIHFAGHAKVAPASSKTVMMMLYRRKHNNGAARGSWGSGIGFAFIIPANTHDVITSWTNDIASWLLSAGSSYQLLISRDPLDVTDDLVNNLEVREFGLEFY